MQKTVVMFLMLGVLVLPARAGSQCCCCDQSKSATQSQTESGKIQPAVPAAPPTTPQVKPETAKEKQSGQKTQTPQKDSKS